VTRYRTIVADPPWTPDLGATWATRFTDKARPQAHYATMTPEEVAATPVPDLAAPQAHLWLWVLTQHIDWGWRVAEGWGFQPVTMLTWAKPGLGDGGEFRCKTELLLSSAVDGTLPALRSHGHCPSTTHAGHMPTAWPLAAHFRIASSPTRSTTSWSRRQPRSVRRAVRKRSARFGWDYPVGDQALGGVAA
jgi:N6-adenosine-specific RNA methylase IME4